MHNNIRNIVHLEWINVSRPWIGPVFWAPRNVVVCRCVQFVSPDGAGMLFYTGSYQIAGRGACLARGRVSESIR